MIHEASVSTRRLGLQSWLGINTPVTTVESSRAFTGYEQTQRKTNNTPISTITKDNDLSTTTSPTKDGIDDDNDVGDGIDGGGGACIFVGFVFASDCLFFVFL